MTAESIKLVTVIIRFYQHGVEGQLDVAAFDKNIGVLRSYEHLRSQIEEEDVYGSEEENEKNTVANILAMFCDVDFEHRYQITNALLGCYIKKHPELHDAQPEVLNINVSDLLEEYGLDENEVIKEFGILALKPNTIMEYKMDSNNLPPEVKAMIEATKASGEQGGVMAFNPETGEAKLLSREEHDAEHGDGSYDEINDLGNDLMQEHIIMKEKNGIQTNSKTIH